MWSTAILYDFYQVAHEVMDVFGVSLSGYLVSSLGDSVQNAPHRDNVVSSFASCRTYESIGVDDHINIVDFRYEMLDKIKIKGMFMYRKNESGIEILSGMAIKKEML